MQLPNFPTINPLKLKLPKTKIKLKLNRKFVLIAIPIILGLLSLLVTTIANQKPTKTTNKTEPTPVTYQQQDPESLQEDNKWQQQLDNINNQLNQNFDLPLPKIDQKITF